MPRNEIPNVRKPPLPVRLRGAVADLRGFAADYRIDPDDLRELAARLERLATEMESENRRGPS